MENRCKEGLPGRPKIIFMGTPDFALPSLNALLEHGHNVVAVVTQPDRPKGRGRKVVLSPVKRAALDLGLHVLQPEKASDPQFCEVIREKTPDILIVVAFGQILRKVLLDIPCWGALNIHASLLPRYRGAAPIQWAILNNEPKTGLTAMRMDEGLDTGPVLYSEEVPILSGETAGDLHDRLAGLSGAFLIRTLEGLSRNRLVEVFQNNTEASYTGKIDRSLCRINWEQPANAVSALIRALDPRPGSFTTAGGKEIKLFSSRVATECAPDKLPGRVLGLREGALEVETGRGSILVGELQIAGKKRLPAEDFLRGFSLEKGKTLGH